MSLLLVVLKVGTSLLFIVLGAVKLAKTKGQVELFHEFRLPLEIMYFIGVIEILGAIALWFDVLTVLVLSGLACLMLGAVKSHAEAKHSFAKMVPAIALFGLCVWGALLANWLN